MRYDASCAAAGISYIGSANATANNPTNGSFSLPGGWAAGDTAIFWWYTYANTKTFTAPPGVTQKQQASSGGYGRIYIGYRVLQAGDSTFSWTSSSVANSTTIWGTSVFRGVDGTGDPFEAQSGAPATFTNARDPNPPAVTTVSNNAWVIPIFGKRNDYTSITTPANYTSAGSNSSTTGNDACAGAAYRQIATPGAENPGAWTLGGGAASDDGYVWTGALRPDSYEQIRVDVSWDGGISWSSPQQTTNLTGAEATYWYDVTGAPGIPWTPAMLNDTNFRVRVDAFTQGAASEVRLDWIPVEVDYTLPLPPTCWLSGWAKRTRLTIDHNDITAPLTDFPVMVYLSTSSGRYNEDVSFVFDELQNNANRFKIAVTTNDCAELYVEIEKWDQASEQAWLWVRVPSISDTTDTILHLYYDSSQADNTTYVGDTNSTPAEMVWDGSFALVQHLGENAAVVHDSTANNNDETNPPPPPPLPNPDPGYIRATYTDAGTINGAYSFNNGSRMQMDHSTSLDITEAITLELFVYLNDRTDGKFLAKDDPFPGGAGCYCLQQETNNLELMLDFGGWYRASYGTYNTGEWIYMVGTYDRMTMRLYLNGIERATNPQTSPITSNNLVALALGNRAYDVGTSYDLNGLLDEVRISATPRSAEWIFASYESGRDDLIDFGPEEGANITNTPSSIDFGAVSENRDYWSNGTEPVFPLDDAECFFTLTNLSSAPVDISIKATNFSGGVGWTLTGGAPGVNSVKMKAGVSGDIAESNMVSLNTGDQDFMFSLGASASQKWEIKLETGTFTDNILEDKHDNIDSFHCLRSTGVLKILYYYRKKGGEKEMRKTLFAIMLALALVLIPVGSAFAATTATVTVTATPSILSITQCPGYLGSKLALSTPVTKIVRNTTYYSNPLGDTTAPTGAAVVDGECRFTLTNNGDVNVDITINMTDLGTMTNGEGGYTVNGATSFGASAYVSGSAWPGGSR